MLPKQVIQRLLVGSILGSLSSPILAQTVVSQETTTPLRTQVAGNITIEEDASIEVASGPPVTIDSPNSLSIAEDGLVEAGEDNGTSGVSVTTTGPFSISNEGAINVLEDFLPEDDDGNGVPDGAIAESSDRAGIRVTSAAQGTIDNQGTISVDGLNSYGIVFDNDFSGSLLNDGSITVIGDYSTGVSLKSFTGDLNLNGTITAAGEGAQALTVSGDINGALRIQGSVGQSGTFTNDDDASMTLSRGDLRVRAPAVEINGDVTGGILVAARPYDLDEDEDDEDGDGTDDSSERTGQISSVGASPALYIGGSDALTIGGITGRDGTFSLAIDGQVTSRAAYSSISTTAIEIGGDQQTVLGQGIGVSGTVSATTYDSGAIAILLNETANVPTLSNSGTISASITSPGDGSTIAIQDLSGTLTNIQNSGVINAAGSREDVKVALDLSKASSGVTINQYLNAIDAETKAEEEEEEDGYNPDSPTIYTAIYGDLLLSKYDDKLSVSSGLISGHTYFGDGNDALALSQDAIYSGDLYGGTGQLAVTLNDRSKYYGTIDANVQAATLDLFGSSRFIGKFANAQNLVANVHGGTLTAESGEVASLGTLNVESGGAIGVIIDGDEGTSSSFDVGTANFASGSKVQTEITSVLHAEGSYKILTADTLNGAPTFDPETNDIPLLYDAELEVGANDLTLKIERKTAEELGFNQAQSAAYSPILTMLADQDSIQSSILQADSIGSLQDQFQGLLPDYSGGVFELASLSSRVASGRITSESHDFFDVSEMGGWISPFYFQSHISGDDSEKMKLSGKGLAGALELFASPGTIGLDLSYTAGRYNNGSRADLKVGVGELGLYFRRSFGPFYAFGRVSGATVKVSSSRAYEGDVDGTEITYSADGDWKGLKLGSLAGASAKFPVANRFSLSPAVSLEYQWLKEKGYYETGDEIGLEVASRTSSRLSALTNLTASIALGDTQSNNVPMTLDLQGGRRFYLTDRLGNTTANFVDGDPFTIIAPNRSGLWQAEAKLHAGDSYATWALSVGGEKSPDQWSATAKASLSVAF